MLPIYKPGDVVLISSLPYLFSKPRIGDIIVFRKDKISMIKKISEIAENGFIVEGENVDDSLDSATLGIISEKDVLGKVIVKL